MKLLDIKNNLVKLSYSTDELIALAGFVVITDGEKSYVAQIVNLKSEYTVNYAIARLILTFDKEGILNNFDGSIPSLNSNIQLLDTKQLLDLLPIEQPIMIGQIAQQHNILKLDTTLFEKNLLICAEKFGNINTIVNNSVEQLNSFDEKAVVIDTDLTFSDIEHFKLKRDFKLPLNVKFLDYIYENDLEDTDASSRAVIEEILDDVREYAKSVEFIPFENFIKVVSDLYAQTEIPELALLKQKLKVYNEQNLFAQNEDDLNAFENKISNSLSTYIDIADIPEKLQRVVISYIQDKLESQDEYIYSFIKIGNKNSTKNLLLKLTNSDKVFTTIICSHSYKYVSELKQLAENMILFAPQSTQHDFANYNTFLNKLNANEFVICGTLTQNIPFLVELAPIADLNSDVVSENNEESISEDSDNNQIDNNATEEANLEETVYEDASTELDLTNIVSPLEEENESEGKTKDSDNTIELIDTKDAESEVEIKTEEEITEQVAKDVDELLFSNKIEEIEPIEEAPSDNSAGVLTEADLDFIEDLPKADEEQIADEKPEVVSDNVADVVETSSLETDLTAENDNFEITEEPQQDEEVPIFPAENPQDSDAINFEQGDEVSHPKYGKGIIEKLIKYGNKTLCSIAFDEVGRRLLDPTISDVTKL